MEQMWLEQLTFILPLEISYFVHKTPSLDLIICQLKAIPAVIPCSLN
jgi:hypothetical protein